MHAVGPVSNTNGTLSATITGIKARNGDSAVCERALTVANNVAIDIDAWDASPSGAAVNIADQIAARVPTRDDSLRRCSPMRSVREIAKATGAQSN